MIRETTQLENENYFSGLFNICCKNGTLYTATIEITRDCNFRCIHCYNLPLRGSSEKKSSLLTLPDFKNLIDSLVKQGCLHIVFTGGEPLLNENFSEIWEYTYKKGLFITLFTNAYLINDKILDLFKKYPPYDIEITMYGFSNKTYKAVTSAKKAYERVKKNILKLKEQKIPFSLKSMVLRQNFHEIKLISNFARKLGVLFKYDLNISPSIDGKETSKLFASNDEILKLFSEVKDSEKARCDLVVDADKFRSKFKKSNKLFSCGAGRASIYIDSTGNIHPCIYSRMPPANVFEKSISDIISNELSDWLGRDISDEDAYNCRNCIDGYYCDWCPAVEDNLNVSSIEKKKWRANICRVARLQKEKFENPDRNADLSNSDKPVKAGYYELKYKEFISGDSYER